jgi:hypothetical protein
MSHAFGYDDGSADITAEDLALFDKIADWVVRRQLDLPAMMALETAAPLNFVGSSMLSFLRPMVGLALNTTQWERLEQLLEKRCTPKLLADRIALRVAEEEQKRKNGA